jgi:hypothetical protein
VILTHSWTHDNFLLTDTFIKWWFHYHWNYSVNINSTLLYFDVLLFSRRTIHLHTECYVSDFQHTQMHNYKLIFLGTKILSIDQFVISTFLIWQQLMFYASFLEQLCCITCSVISGCLGWYLYTSKHYEVKTKCVIFAHRIIQNTEMKIKQLHL